MAVKKPTELDFSDKKFMCIISGQPGLGKTTLALSAPEPFLFDTDNGVSRVRAEHRSVTSNVSTYGELLEDMNSKEFQAAKTIIIDTGGTLVQLMKDWTKKQDAKAARDGRAMYGVIKTEFDRLCWHIRNVARKHLIVVFHTTEQAKGDTIQTRLSCEGSTKDIVWTPADFGGHMFMMGNKRVIGFTPTDEYFAKGCFGVAGILPIPELKPGDKNTFFADLFAKAQENINQESAIYCAERERYDAALAAGLQVIESIVDVESADAAVLKLAKINHALTSRAEIMAAYKVRMAQVNIRFNSKEKRHEVLDDAKSAKQLAVLPER